MHDSGATPFFSQFPSIALLLSLVYVRWPVQTGYDTKDTRTRFRKYIRRLRKVSKVSRTSLANGHSKRDNEFVFVFVLSVLSVSACDRSSRTGRSRVCPAFLLWACSAGSHAPVEAPSWSLRRRHLATLPHRVYSLKREQ